MKLVSNCCKFVFLLNVACSSFIVAPAYAGAQKIKSEQVFHRGNYDEPDTLDPQKAFAVPDYQILHDLYEGLTTFDESGNIVLGQAQSYDISNNGKTYTFHLKDNLRWSNGEPLTAYDFEAGIRRAIDPKIGSQNFILLKSIINSEEINKGKLSVEALGVKAVNAKTLVIELEHPLPYLKSLLTHNAFMPVYQPNLEKNGDNFTRPGEYITNGPFKLKEWVVNSHVTLKKNKNFRAADSVRIDKVIFYPITNASMELKRYRAGDIDYTAKIPLESIDWLQKNFQDELSNSPMLAAYYYTFNVTKPPFMNNKQLRRALSLAIDKDIIANKLMGGKRIATDRFVPAGVFNYPAAVSSSKSYLNYDPILAKKCYKEAGYSANNKLKVKLLYHTNESNKVIATAIASMWKKTLGVEVELVNQEWKIFLKTRLERNETQVFREGWVGSYNDPTAFLDLFLSNNPQNSSGYYNENYDSLLLRAKEEADLTKRGELLLQAENLLLEDAPVIPIYSPQSYHLIKPYIGGASVNLFDVTLSRFVYIKQDKEV